MICKVQRTPLLHTTHLTSIRTLFANHYHQDVKKHRKAKEKMSLIMIIDRSDLSETPAYTRMRMRR